MQKMSPKEYIFLALNLIRCFPHLIVYNLHKNKPVILADIKRSYKLMERDYLHPFGLVYLLAFSRPFRNLFYYRTRPFSSLLHIICPESSSLRIQTKEIGEGLAIIHGTASEIGAVSIGKNCIIYQQVTIGGTNEGAPKILDNVTIYPGAVVIGKITVGNNVVIGANATVYKNVPDNGMVLPGSTKVMTWKVMPNIN